MAEPSLKDCLKSAREAIDKKDYNAALQWSESAVKLDKANYNVYLFIGIAASKLNQTPKSEQAYLY